VQEKLREDSKQGAPFAFTNRGSASSSLPRGFLGEMVIACQSGQTGQIGGVSKTWQLQEAKDQFSTVVERALTDGLQIVTRHGKPAVVIVSVEEFRKLQPPRQPLSRFLARSPLRDLGGTPERQRDLPRKVPL